MRCASWPRRIAPAMRALPLNVCSVRRSASDRRAVAGCATPRAEVLAGLREQLRGLVEEDRQHLRVDVVANAGERIVLAVRQLDFDSRSTRRRCGHDGESGRRLDRRNGRRRIHDRRRCNRHRLRRRHIDVDEHIFQRERFGGGVGADVLELALRRLCFRDVARA